MCRWDENVAGAVASSAPQVRQVRGQPLPGADAQRPPPPGSDAGPTCSRGTGTKTHTSAFRTDEKAVLLCGVNSHLKTVARPHEANPVRPRGPRSPELAVPRTGLAGTQALHECPQQQDSRLLRKDSLCPSLINRRQVWSIHPGPG